MNKIVFIFVFFFSINLSAQQSIREIVSEKFSHETLMIGSACHHNLIDTKSGEILDKEFNYVTPANDFKQSYIHPEPGNIYKWTKPDDWVQHCKENNQVIRIHGPISPQCSVWAREDDRKAEEMDQLLDEFMTALCKRYNQYDHILWMDVVNETIDKTNGDWFGPKEGTDKWENPWTILGFDTTVDLAPPLYIEKAFRISNEHAPDIKQMINQHGALEAGVWEKMKELTLYLRGKGIRVDGLGWQAHVDVGWEKIPGNLERLSNIIDWCDTNNLAFHITEFNVFLRNGNEGKLEEQTATFSAISQAIVSKVGTAALGINYWHIRAGDTSKSQWDGCMWDADYEAKPSYKQLKDILKNQTMSLDDLDNSLKLNIYPNPSRGDFYIDSKAENIDYQLFSINGREIKQGKVISKQLKLEVTKGPYILKFTSENKNSLNKVIVN